MKDCTTPPGHSDSDNDSEDILLVADAFGRVTLHGVDACPERLARMNWMATALLHAALLYLMLLNARDHGRTSVLVTPDTSGRFLRGRAFPRLPGGISAKDCVRALWFGYDADLFRFRRHGAGWELLLWCRRCGEFDHDDPNDGTLPLCVRRSFIVVVS